MTNDQRLVKFVNTIHCKKQKAIDTQRLDSSALLADEKIFPPFRNGPLTPYRKSAGFCWKRMRLILEDPDYIKLQVIENDSLKCYKHSRCESTNILLK